MDIVPEKGNVPDVKRAFALIEDSMKGLRNFESKH